MSQTRPINKQHRHGNQERKEVLEIVSPNAVCQPYAMVVVSGDTGLADTAMFTPGRFLKATGIAYAAWVEKNSIKRIKLHLLLVILGSDR